MTGVGECQKQWVAIISRGRAVERARRAGTRMRRCDARWTKSPNARARRVSERDGGGVGVGWLGRGGAWRVSELDRGGFGPKGE